MTAFARATRILDEVQHQRQVDGFDPAAFDAAVAAEAPAPGTTLEALGGEMDAWRGLLTGIDRFTEKTMRIALTQSADALPAKLKILVHSTLLAYQHDLALLRQRIGGALARVDPEGAGDLTERIIAAAERVLELRARLRAGVVAQAQRAAEGWRPAADRAARDRSQADAVRDQWRRARMDLAQLVATPEFLDEASFAERLERITDPEDPPEEERPHRFSLLELD